jgi:hypothetical protein
MLWGSSALLKRSIKHYVPLIEVIASVSPKVWEIDAHAYTNESIELLLETARQLGAALPEGASGILVTKIMLGVFGCVPAYDAYFKRGFGASAFGRKSLLRIAQFYWDNAEAIEAHRVPTLDFMSGAETHCKYTRAKVIDMIFSLRVDTQGSVVLS